MPDTLKELKRRHKTLRPMTTDERKNALEYGGQRLVRRMDEIVEQMRQLQEELDELEDLMGALRLFRSEMLIKEAEKK